MADEEYNAKQFIKDSITASGLKMSVRLTKSLEAFANLVKENPEQKTKLSAILDRVKMFD